MFISAAWSTPGLFMKPAIEGIARAYRLPLTELDAGGRPGLVREYAVRSLPAILLLEDGRIVRRWEGFHSAWEIREALGEARETPRS